MLGGPLARRVAPVAVLLGGLALFFALGLDDYLSIEALRAHRVELVGFVAARPVAAALAYVAIYALAIAFSVPGGTIMTISGGFLFGTWLATGLTVIGATAGACAVFTIAKTSLGDPLRARAGPWLKRMEHGFGANAFNYLLVLRLVPLFPFFVVNIVPAFLGVRLGVYLAATFLGIIPATFVFASVGAGIGSVLESGAAITPASALTPEVIVALVGLSVLALLPVAYRALRRRRG
ncbi:MAG: VTT domain-containing protein [Alphaproteobacteria bacterium]